MPEEKGGPVKRRDIHRTASHDLFLVQSRLDDIDRRVRSIHRWVVMQRIFFWIKVFVFLGLFAVGLRAWMMYVPMVKEELFNMQVQIDAFRNAIPQPGKPFDLQEFLLKEGVNRLGE